MLIRQVDLENIKSYEHASVTFTPGVNAIVGHNGAGKSTLLEAIGFALFDSLPYKTADFVREGARSGMVAVTFESAHDERAYRVERRVGGSHQYVVYDAELQAKLCEGKADVLAFVRKHSGADPDIDMQQLFSDAVGVPQGTLTSVFLLAPSQRKPTFDALLQVDEYRVAVDRLREPRNLLQERQHALEQEIAGLKARLERLPLLEEAIAARAAELAQITGALASLQRRLAEVRTRREALESIRREIEQLERRQAALNERTAALTAQLAEAERLLAAAQAARTAVEANQDGFARYTAAQAQRSTLDQQLRQRQGLRDARAAADKTLALTTADLSRTEEELKAVAAAEQTVARLASAVARQGELEHALTEAQHAQRMLAEIERTLGDLRGQADQLEARRKRLASQAERSAAVAAEIAAAEQQLQSIRATVTETTHEMGKQHALAEEIKSQNKTLSEVATTTCPVCEQPLTPAHRQQMLERNELRIKDLRAQYVTARDANKLAETELKQVEDRHKALVDEQRTLPRQSELDDVAQRQAETLKAISTAETRHAELTLQQPHVEQIKTELAALGDPRRQSLIAAQQAGQRAALESRRDALQQAQAKAQQQVDEAEAALQGLAGLDAAVAQVEAELAAHQSAHQAVIANRSLAESLEARATEHARLQTALATSEQECAELERTLTNAQAQLDPEEYRGLLSEEQSTAEQVGGLQGRSQSLEREQQRDAQEAAALHRQQSELAGLEAAHGKLLNQSAVLDSVRTLLRQSGPYITQALIHQISAGATQIFGELMQDFSRQLRWNDDYGITLEVDGVARQFAQLSGGEQMSAALAVRLALVREISNIDIAFFDEPTANLDDVRREALAQQIMNVKGFRQLFVISHDDTFEQATQNLVRVKRHGSTSIVGRAESS